MTTIRLKSYNKDAAKFYCRNMINKLNEVGLDLKLKFGAMHFIYQIVRLTTTKVDSTYLG